ncbi:MAG: SAM-dependent DNA methyltransferase [Bacteroidales bacterium]|nr:SAM-dependent DNA methyltransferase [Bacteroidales bacterium]
MITGKIKSQIDAIWMSFWTGGISNSIDVLEQMTYLFFMKMLDDAQLNQEATAQAMGLKDFEDPKAVFKKGNWHNPDTDKDVPYYNLRWNVFRQFTPEKMFDTVRFDVFTFIKNISNDETSAYSRFMNDAVFLIQQPRTLVKVVEGIQELDMNDRDTMGDVYEYVLGKMAAAGTNGQFRTPRHIIRMMVELMQPKVDDRICDPAMGTAGFLVESAKYLKANYSQELLKKQNLTHFRTGMFSGFDTDPKMLRIGSMNLMLNGVDNPNIVAQDSLSNQNTKENTYTLCLANPPFSGSLDHDVVNPTLLAMAKTKKTELLFISLFIRMLELGGRCASIVPDGVLFGNSSGHKAIRKELIDKQRLQAVISMPSGVFKPYAGVSTAILVFTKTGAGGTDKVWFYDMKADGFSLDDKRNPIADNDIPDVIARFRNLEAEVDRTRKEQSFLVPVEEIREKDYDLSINKYKEVEKVKVEYEKPEVVFDRIETLQKEIAEAMEEFRTKYL